MMIFKLSSILVFKGAGSLCVESLAPGVGRKMDQYFIVLHLIDPLDADTPVGHLLTITIDPG